MSKRYTPAEKAEALDQLRINGGNIAYTSTQTGIPERTLRHWRQEEWRKNAQESLPLPPHPPRRRQQLPYIDVETGSTEVLLALRQQIINHIIQAAPTLIDGLNTTSPYHRVLAVSQLIEHLRWLDAYIPRAERFDERKQNQHISETLDEIMEIAQTMFETKHGKRPTS